MWHVPSEASKVGFAAEGMRDRHGGGRSACGNVFVAVGAGIVDGHGIGRVPDLVLATVRSGHPPS